MKVAYDPSNRFEIKAWDVEFRRDPARTLMARIYQPQGGGPFPALLDLHGGAWNNQDRTANAPMDESLARSGILVVAIDLRRAPEAPYPASVQDANYGVRWLKHKAREWNGDPETVGALGSSSSGHEIELCAMRPKEPRYNAHPLPEAPNLDATVAYVVARSPVSDPFARYQQAEKRQWKEMIQNIQANNGPDLQHTLNYLALPDDPLYIAAPDFLSRDLFARYGQTYQLFFNGAVHVPTVFAV